MTRSLKTKRTIIFAAFALAIWVSPGCEVSNEMSEDDQILSSIEGIKGEGSDIASRAQAVTDEEEPTPWPEGWMVVHHEEWIPILDEAGRRLHAAREAFLNGDQRAAIDGIRQSILYLEAQVADSSERDRAALTTAITMLRAIMSRFGSEDEVTLVQLDIAFANAYRSDLEREALAVQTGSGVPYLEQPVRHLQRAIERFLANDPEEAARDIDRASAYLYLEGHRLGLSERAELNEAAQNLERLAARLRVLEIRDPAELERVFEPARRTWRQHAIAPTRPPTLGLISQ